MASTKSSSAHLIPNPAAGSRGGPTGKVDRDCVHPWPCKRAEATMLRFQWIRTCPGPDDQMRRYREENQNSADCGGREKPETRGKKEDL